MRSISFVAQSLFQATSPSRIALASASRVSGGTAGEGAQLARTMKLKTALLANRRIMESSFRAKMIVQRVRRVQFGCPRCSLILKEDWRGGYASDNGLISYSGAGGGSTGRHRSRQGQRKTKAEC